MDLQKLIEESDYEDLLRDLLPAEEIAFSLSSEPTPAKTPDLTNDQKREKAKILRRKIGKLRNTSSTAANERIRTKRNALKKELNQLEYELNYSEIKRK